MQEDDPTTDPNCGSSQNESRVGNYVPQKKSVEAPKPPPKTAVDRSKSPRDVKVHIVHGKNNIKSPDRRQASIPPRPSMNGDRGEMLDPDAPPLEQPQKRSKVEPCYNCADLANINF